MNVERVCPYCGEPLGRIEQRSWQADVKPEWNSAHFCANPDCKAYLEPVASFKRAGMKNTDACRKEEKP